MDNYEQFLVEIGRLGEVLTMPVALVGSVIIVCAVFLVWRLASWTFHRNENPSQGREPIPPAPMDLTPLKHAAGWGLRRLRGTLPVPARSQRP